MSNGEYVRCMVGGKILSPHSNTLDNTTPIPGKTHNQNEWKGTKEEGRKTNRRTSFRGIERNATWDSSFTSGRDPNFGIYENFSSVLFGDLSRNFELLHSP